MAAAAVDTSACSPSGLQEKMRRQRQLALERYRANGLAGGLCGLGVGGLGVPPSPEARRQNDWSHLLAGLEGPSPSLDDDGEATADNEASPKSPRLFLTATQSAAANAAAAPAASVPAFLSSSASAQSSSSVPLLLPLRAAARSPSAPPVAGDVVGATAAEAASSGALALASTASSPVAGMQRTKAGGFSGPLPSPASPSRRAAAAAAAADAAKAGGFSGALPRPPSSSRRTAAAAEAVKAAAAGPQQQQPHAPEATLVENPLLAAGPMIGPPELSVAADLLLGGGFSRAAAERLPGPLPLQRTRQRAKAHGWSLEPQDEAERLGGAAYAGDGGGACGSSSSDCSSRPVVQCEELVIPISKIDDVGDTEEVGSVTSVESLRPFIGRRATTPWPEALEELHVTCLASSISFSSSLTHLSPPGVLEEEAAAEHEHEGEHRQPPAIWTSGRSGGFAASDSCVATIGDGDAWPAFPSDDCLREDSRLWSGDARASRRCRDERESVGERRAARRGGRLSAFAKFWRDASRNKVRPVDPASYGDVMAKTEVRPVDRASYGDVVTKTEVCAFDPARFGDDTLSVD